jgi:signal transduction histidine kinase
MRRSLRRIFTSAIRMDRLLGDLSDLIDLDAGRLRLDRRRTELGRLLSQLVGDMPMESRRHVQLELRGDVHALLDPDRIERVIGSLIENALAHVAIGPDIVVRLDRRGDLAIVTVADSGPGLTADQIKMSFEAHPPDGGPPLHVARRIVEAHGGKIDVESTAGKGTRYVIELPALR